MFQPAILSPDPDPWFCKELRKIDPDLRVMWGYLRYFRNCWVIERKISSDRYHAMYASLLEADAPRFMDQPIYDTNQPIFSEVMDVDGNPIQMGYAVVGYRKYDLAPDYEWVMFVENKDGSRRELDSRTLLELKRAYAWDRFHSYTRIRIEKEREREKAEAAQKAQRCDEYLDAVREGWRRTGKILFGGQPEKVFAGES